MTKSSTGSFCGDCDGVYLGETGRSIGEWVKEHCRDIRLARTDGLAVAEHVWKMGHSPNWDEVTCVDHDQYWFTRRIKEAIQTRLHPSNFNRDNGIEIPEAWDRMVKRHAAHVRATANGHPPHTAERSNNRAAARAQDPQNHIQGAWTSLQPSPDEVQQFAYETSRLPHR